jgi:hypothetical protein
MDPSLFLPDPAQLMTEKAAGVDMQGFPAPTGTINFHALKRCQGGTNRSKMERGCWWGAWFATCRGGELGRRLQPGVAVLESPLLLASGTTTTTAGAQVAAAARFAVFDGTLATPKARRMYAPYHPENRQWLAELHSRLGSDEMSCFDEVASDERLMTPSYLEGTEQTETLLAELYRRLDPDPVLHAYLDWALPVVVAHKRGTPALPEPPPEGLGAWRVAADALFFRVLHEREDAAPRQRAEAAWRLMRNPPGMDCGTKTVSLFRRCMGEQGMMAAAVVRLVSSRAHLPAEIGDDPLFPAIEAAREPGYDGRAHMLAAGAFYEAGELVRAWEALMHATYWLVAGTGQRWRWPLMPSLIALAQKAGWQDIEEVLRLCHPSGQRWAGEDEQEP